MSGTPEPGWYADPADAGRHRYWDGMNWTGKTRPAGASLVPFSGSSPSKQTGLWIGLAVGFLAIAGISTALVVALGSDRADSGSESDKPLLVPLDDSSDSTPDPGPSPTTFPSDVVVPEGWVLYTSETGVMSYAVEPDWEDLIAPGDQEDLREMYVDGGIENVEYSGAWSLTPLLMGTNFQRIDIIATDEILEAEYLHSVAVGYAAQDVPDFEIVLDEEFTSARGYPGWRTDLTSSYYEGDISYESVIVLKAGRSLVYLYVYSAQDFDHFIPELLTLADSIVVHHPPDEN